MLNRVFIILMVMTSIAYAEIGPVSIEDVKDHNKVASKLNEIIFSVNNELNKKASNESVQVVKAHYEITAKELGILRGNLSKVRAKVGDPTGTVADVRTKFIKLMDTLDSAPQHVAVTP